MAYGSVNVPGNLPNKQNLLTGQAGQVVGFDGTGLAYAMRGWSNQNLLDNWYFPYPINQRGASGTISAPGYFIDRWKLVSGSVTLSGAGLVLNGTIVQILERGIGSETTASVLTTEGVMAAEYDDASRTFSITASGQTLVAAKLELGSRQTLAYQDGDGTQMLNDPPPNMALELEKCQRYQLKLGTLGNTRVAAGCCATASMIIFPIPVPVTLRVKPTISFSTLDDLECYVNGANIIIPTEISVNHCASNSVDLMFTVSGVTPGADAILRIVNSGWMMFDANL